MTAAKHGVRPVIFAVRVARSNPFGIGREQSRSERNEGAAFGREKGGSLITAELTTDKPEVPATKHADMLASARKLVGKRYRRARGSRRERSNIQRLEPDTCPPSAVAEYLTLEVVSVLEGLGLIKHR